MKVRNVHVDGDFKIHIHEWVVPKVGGYYYVIRRNDRVVYSSGRIDDWRYALADALDVIDNELIGATDFIDKNLA